jgi:hypothetical protein
MKLPCWARCENWEKSGKIIAALAHQSERGDQ